MDPCSDNLDRDGFRPNVGIVLQNDHGQVFWGRRVGGFDAWQFPQGGIERGESVEHALYRELQEEVGLCEDDVEIRCRTRGWLRYRTPEGLRRRSSAPGFLGQKQKWFLLRLLADDDAVCTNTTDKPEFDDWRWVSYWYPVGKVIAFKRGVYRRALRELAPALTLGACAVDARGKRNFHPSARMGRDRQAALAAAAVGEAAGTTG